ncbi:MAG TPA: DUF6191 domain-containing protein [Pseudonocardiaceae bacterium]|jgi:hypothetical protein|nr:DUF6191 domain-containing protein [Pseudonocardiaceae bacterium]
MSIPGLVVLLTMVITLERFGLWINRISWLPWRRRRTGMPVSATGFDTLDAVFTDRRAEFEQRVTHSMWREDAEAGAPPFGVDLDTGRATLPRSARPE